MNKQQLAAKIWESANQMRSKIEANEYKDYILGFIFYKYLSDQEIEFATTQGMSAKGISALSEDDADTVDYIKKELGYFIAYDHLFSTWLTKGNDFDVSNVRDALSAFARLIHPNHKKLFDGIFNTLQTGLSKLGENAAKQTRAISDLLQLIKDIPMDGKQGYDVLGYIYEYLIEKFAANAGKKAGEFYTPHEVSLLMSEIIAHHLKDREKIEIYDPTSGSGSLLINIGNSLAKHVNDENNIKYYAQELKANTYNLTRMNLIMRGILPNNIVTRNGDTLEDDWPFFDENDPLGSYNPLYVDAVVSNPPYSQKWEPDHKENDPRYARFGLAPKTKADYAFLLHDLYHLKPDGMMTIVLPHGVLFRGGQEGAIRKQLIEQNHIDTIIGLPANIFFGTGIPTIILVLRQKRDSIDKPNTDVLIIDASKHFLKVGKNNKLQASDIKRIADTVIHRETTPKFSKVVSKATIRDNDYNLNIPRYVDASNDAESWDLHATMLGGIPEKEINQLSAYWQTFPALREILFKPKSSDYSELKIAADTLQHSITQHPQVKNFSQAFNHAFIDFNDYLKQQLITPFINTDGQQGQNINIAQQKAILSKELFKSLAPIALIDKYQAYQLLDNSWQIIATDLEMIQSEGFAVSKQVDPHMVYKKDKNSEVQNGWQGHIIQFDLVQDIYHKSKLQALKQQENRLAEISTNFEEILESLSEEDKEADTIKDSNDAFINATVIKVAKALKAEIKTNGKFEIESYEAKILQVDALISEEKKLKKSLKADSETLHLQTKATIENLSDEQVHELLEHKWIKPLLNELNKLPDDLIKQLTNQVQQLADKYASTYGDIDKHIKETQQELLGLIAELEGSETDKQALEAFSVFLKDEGK